MAFAHDKGEPFFYAAMGVLYALASIRLWRREQTGGWLLVLAVFVWVAVALRAGHLPPLEEALTFLAGPVIGLLGWRELHPLPPGRASLVRLNWAVIIVLVLGIAVVAPLWQCHEGFGGSLDYHCHSVLRVQHAH